MKLSQNKVSTGHPRNMMDTKDPTKKLAVDMPYIFGVRVDVQYSAPPPPPPKYIYNKRRNTLPNGGFNGGAVADWKRRRRDNRRYDYNGSIGGTAKKNKKRDRASE